MTTAAAPKKLYLFRLSTTAIPLPGGQTLEMSSGSYLVETADNKHILIDSGMAPDAPLSPAPPSTNEKNVLEHLAELNVRPRDIDILVCTHFASTTPATMTRSRTPSSLSSANTTPWPATAIRASQPRARIGTTTRCAIASSTATPNSSPASLCSRPAATLPATNPSWSAYPKPAQFSWPSTPQCCSAPSPSSAKPGPPTTTSSNSARAPGNSSTSSNVNKSNW